MKKNIIKLFSLAVLALAGWSCESEYYNENYLDGWESTDEITDVQEVEYTLASGDYATIAKNSTNKATAEAAGDEAVAALAAIGTNKYFSTAAEVEMYLPAFVSSLYPTLDNSSVVKVTYKSALEVPAEIAAMNAATSYTVKSDDYKTIWDSEEEYVEAVTPATLSKLSTVLPSEGLEAGDYVAVTYNYSAEEPKADEPEEPVDPEIPVDPEQPEVKFPGAGKYLIVALTETANVAATPLAAEKKYGYPAATEVTIANNAIAADETTNALAWTVAAATTEGEYTLQGTDGRYYYLSGSYNSFNVSDTAGEDGYTFTFVPNEDGTFAITNVTMTKSLQYDSNYSSYGCYPDIRGVVPHLFVLNAAGTAYEDVTAVSAPVGNNYTSVLGSAKKDDVVEVKGYISAESAQGPILTDNGGSVLLYKTTGYALGDEVTVTGTISSYNYGFQIGTNGLTIEKTGTTIVAYPAPMELTGAVMDELLTTRTEDGYAIYAKMTGTVSISGNYYNFLVDGATTAQGSFYGITDAIKAKVSDGMQCTLYGYFCSISKSGGAPKYINMIVTDVAAATATAAAKTATVQSEKKYAYYQWDGSAFKAAEIACVQPSDYTAMGQTYGNFTDPKQDQYLPKFLNVAYPYAMADEVVYVAYRCYSGGATSWRVDEYKNDGTAWVKTVYFADKTDQFRKTEGVWAIDRTLELDYTGNGADTKAFYQYCVNWVYDNKDVPMGAPARDNAGVIISTDIVTIGGNKPAGDYWVSNYGNNEFYTGASAYYGNIDWRASACRGGFTAAGMGNLSDDEIVAKLQEHTAEVFAEVLHYVYPEMTQDDYNFVVVKVYAYGPNANYSYKFAVTGTGTFTYVEGPVAL